jgi:hypothetical protein
MSDQDSSAGPAGGATKAVAVLSLGRSRALRAHRRFKGLPEQWRYGRELQEWTRALLCYAFEDLRGSAAPNEDLRAAAGRLRSLRDELEAAASSSGP